MNDILFEEIQGKNGNIGVITLNRPQALNALTHGMFKALKQTLSVWEHKDSIKAVMIRAVEGRAFCAGGDVKSVYEKRLSKDATVEDFFKDEYEVNRMIHHYAKPYIALLDGITMGGGAGVSIHGSHRIATERMSFAMPETTIGFFPDVGASYFLSKLPYKIGFYLGLSGDRIVYNDAFDLGLVNYIISSENQIALTEALRDANITNNQDVSNIVRKFTHDAAPSHLLTHKEIIKTSFSQVTIEQIIEKLDSSDWGKQVIGNLKTKSPTSLKVTLQEMIRGEKLDFDACMDMEYGIMQQFLKSHDFLEGVRALLIDKDKHPIWKPNNLNLVTDASISHYFEDTTQAY